MHQGWFKELDMSIPPRAGDWGQKNYFNVTMPAAKASHPTAPTPSVGYLHRLSPTIQILPLFN